MQRITVTGRVGLSLISESSSKQQISVQGLKVIGQLLLYISREILPLLPDPRCFDVKDNIEREYVDLFCSQLQISERSDMDLICFHAMSALVNKDLGPHYDRNNPGNDEDDVTFSTTVPIPTCTLPESVRDIAISMYGHLVPLCLVGYKRKALFDLINRMKRLEQFINSDPSSRDARFKLKELLESVYTDADFIGSFFKRRNWLEQQAKFYKHIPQHANIEANPINIIERNEAVDKMAYWSSILHLYYLYALKNELVMEDIFGFVLFFSHQCNGTYVFVRAMMNIITEEGGTSTPTKSLYYRLTEQCCELKKIDFNGGEVKDVGCGPFPRHQTSNNQVFDGDQLSLVITKLNVLFANFGKQMKETNKKDDKDKYRIVQELMYKLSAKTSRFKIPGHGELRAMHLIQLSALIGILPLGFYVYTPMHLTGGPKKYLEQLHNYRTPTNMGEAEGLLEWTVRENQELQKHFTSEFTGNMHENAACIIARGNIKKDIIYQLPWYQSRNSNIFKSICQLMFRVNGYGKNDWTLECYSGGNRSVVLHSKETEEDGTSVIMYNYSDGKQLSARDHHVNYDLIGKSAM